MEENERTAYLYGAEMGGEYLKEIGKSDLATLTPQEVLTFSECMCKNFWNKITELNCK
tara:strand:+ start:273 stop:446 length:174 start_codon:yes stop_codon:yes gene_type:complete